MLVLEHSVLVVANAKQCILPISLLSPKWFIGIIFNSNGEDASQHSAGECKGSLDLDLMQCRIFLLLHINPFINFDAAKKLK